MHINTLAAAAILAATALGTSAYAASAQPEPVDNLWRLPVPEVARDEPHPPIDVLARLRPGADAQVYIFNIGSQPLQVSNVKLGGDYAQQFQIVTDGCTGQPLPPQASCPLTVAGQPFDGMEPVDVIGAHLMATYNSGEFADALVTVQATADADNIIVGDAQ
jgi:hypothetical protein